MSYRLVGSNMVLFLLGIEEDDNVFFLFTMVGSLYVLITAVSPDGKASSVVCVNIGYGFNPKLHFV